MNGSKNFEKNVGIVMRKEKFILSKVVWKSRFTKMSSKILGVGI